LETFLSQHGITDGFAARRFGSPCGNKSFSGKGLQNPSHLREASVVQSLRQCGPTAAMQRFAAFVSPPRTTMAERKYTHGLSTRDEQGVTVVDIGDMEIWDGADLSLLRDTLAILIQRERCKAIAVDMATVKFVPSGFFGMLFDWFEQGVSVRLIAPQPRVMNMLWFKRFFIWEKDNRYRHRTGSGRVVTQ
jgi:hypothetical protein